MAKAHQHNTSNLQEHAKRTGGRRIADLFPVSNTTGICPVHSQISSPVTTLRARPRRVVMVGGHGRPSSQQQEEEEEE